MCVMPSAAKLLAAAATLAVLLFAAPAGAVIDGTSDTANTYANVGVLQLNVDGEWFDFCSGTPSAVTSFSQPRTAPIFSSRKGLTDSVRTT